MLFPAQLTAGLVEGTGMLDGGAKADAGDAGSGERASAGGVDPPSPRKVASLSLTEVACSTAEHAFGRSDSITGRGFAGGFAFGSFFGGAQGSLVNHQASDLSQPSPAGTEACGLQPLAPCGHLIRT